MRPQVCSVRVWSVSRSLHRHSGSTQELYTCLFRQIAQIASAKVGLFASLRIPHASNKLDDGIRRRFISDDESTTLPPTYISHNTRVYLQVQKSMGERRISEPRRMGLATIAESP